MADPVLVFSPSPHLHTSRTSAGAMRHVLIALVPAVACALYYFGLPALEVLAIAVASCMATEWIVTRLMLRRKNSLSDCSALLTGVLLALNLPSSLPWWMVMAGSVMAIGIAKMAFGGLGCNIFNPALVGRVFLLISFPVAMTTWPLPDAGFGDADGVTGPTILGMLKHTLPGGEMADASAQGLLEPFLGEVGGSMGEVSALAILVGFAYLLALKVIKWHIPIAVFAGVALVDLFAGFPVALDLVSGGLMLGAVFMATDYVTSPMTSRGMLLYGLLIGIITASIR
ncbi:MAG: RnfABCDGE type electron transport complex subunit D, partial [Muribaculaceae bacterium]|nr:RnfABCDGE type electron transport complex subunit D [Muribaculaceae bacterium]